eukprot:5310062-Amphidinium_carterae.1
MSGSLPPQRGKAQTRLSGWIGKHFIMGRYSNVGDSCENFTHHAVNITSPCLHLGRMQRA